jgi:hypothetical protein
MEPLDVFKMIPKVSIWLSSDKILSANDTTEFLDRVHRPLHLGLDETFLNVLYPDIVKWSFGWSHDSESKIMSKSDIRLINSPFLEGIPRVFLCISLSDVRREQF